MLVIVLNEGFFLAIIFEINIAKKKSRKIIKKQKEKREQKYVHKFKSKDNGLKPSPL